MGTNDLKRPIKRLEKMSASLWGNVQGFGTNMFNYGKEFYWQQQESSLEGIDRLKQSMKLARLRFETEMNKTKKCWRDTQNTLRDAVSHPSLKELPRVSEGVFWTAAMSFLLPLQAALIGLDLLGKCGAEGVYQSLLVAWDVPLSNKREQLELRSIARPLGYWLCMAMVGLLVTQLLGMQVVSLALLSVVGVSMTILCGAVLLGFLFSGLRDVINHCRANHSSDTKEEVSATQTNTSKNNPKPGLAQAANRRERSPEGQKSANSFFARFARAETSKQSTKSTPSVNQKELRNDKKAKA